MVKAAKKQPAKKQAAKKAPRKTKKPEAKKNTAAAAKQKKQTMTNQHILTKLISLQEEQQKQDEVEVSDFEEESLEEEEELELEEELQGEEEGEQEGQQVNVEDPFLQIIRQGFIAKENDTLLLHQPLHVIDLTEEKLGFNFFCNLQSKHSLEVDYNTTWQYYPCNNIIVCDFNSVEKHLSFFANKSLPKTMFLFCCQRKNSEEVLFCNLPTHSYKNVYCCLEDVRDVRGEFNKNIYEEVMFKGNENTLSSSDVKFAFPSLPPQKYSVPSSFPNVHAKKMNERLRKEEKKSAFQLMNEILNQSSEVCRKLYQKQKELENEIRSLEANNGKMRDFLLVELLDDSKK